MLTIKIAISHLSISLILLLVINITLFLLLNPLQGIYCMLGGNTICLADLSRLSKYQKQLIPIIS